MTATTTRVSTTPLAARRPFWESPLGQTVRELARNHVAMVGLGILVFWILVALTVSFIVPFDPLKADVGNRLSPPGASHWFGTDDLGRDVFKRVLFGSRYSILAGFLTVLAALLIGCAIGAVAGYFGGWIDNVLMCIADMVLAFPSIALAMAIAAALGPGLKNALIAIVVMLWPEYARLMRGQVLAVKANEYVAAAEALGAGRARLLVRHILPNTQAPIVVKATLDVGAAIVLTAGLSFIGLGAVPPDPEWGAMIREGQRRFSQWWMATFPGLAIFSVVMALNFLGDGLRDALDPRRRGRWA
jgi:peptide/nickel transport system permease protein